MADVGIVNTKPLSKTEAALETARQLYEGLSKRTTRMDPTGIDHAERRIAYLLKIAGQDYAGLDRSGTASNDQMQGALKATIGGIRHRSAHTTMDNKVLPRPALRRLAGLHGGIDN